MESFLTDLQRKVLEFRAKNMTQDEIAKLLGTSKANISIIEKRARKNIEKAINTLSIWEEINSLLSIRIEAGTDIFTIPELVYNEGDKRGIKIPLSTVDIISTIANKAEDIVENRILKQPVKLFITRDNRIGIRPINPKEIV